MNPNPDSVTVRLVRTVLVAMAIGASCVHASDGPGVRFQRVGSETGPPPEVITAMLQDRIGFVWIGTREGLFRYDGESFVTYRHDPGDPGSISGNTVRAIFEDRSGRLWFGTNSAGLNRIDLATGRFEHYRHDSADPSSLSHDSVYEIAQDRAGNLWVATQKGLNRLDEGSGTITRFLFDPDDPHSLSHDYVTRLLIDRRDRIWAGTNGGGLNLLDPSTGRFTRFLTDERLEHRLSLRQIFALCEDESGNLWIGGPGLFRMDADTEGFEPIESPASDPSAFEEGLVVDLAVARTGNLWVGTFGRGLYDLDPATGLVRAYRNDPLNRHSLGEDKVMILKVDSADSLWIGTWGAGVWRLTDPAIQLADSNMADSAPPEGIRNIDVTALVEGSRGRLWIGTRFGDLLGKDPDRPGLQQYSSSTGIINDIEETGDGLIWIGKANGLERVNTETGTIRYFRHDPQVDSSIGPGYVTALLEDDESRLWVGTGEGGLQRLNPAGEVVERWVHDPEDPTSLSDNYVKALVQDVAGTIWVGTRSGGLNSYDPVTGQGQRFQPDPDDPTSISYHYVTTVFRDSRDRLWIGTDGGGLNRLRISDDGNVVFDRVSLADGLIDDSVMGILEDDDGSLWLSTKRGLSRFDPQTRRFSQLFPSDGLPSGEFEPGAAARTEGTLYFGSVRWLAAIPAGTEFSIHPASPVVITSIRDVKGEVVGGQPPWLRSRLEVPFGSWISLTLAVLDFNVEHNHRFQFRLGDDEPWVDIGSRREVSFMDFDPGTHEFEARAHNCQGVWNDLPQTLTIFVPAPMWMTWWFRTAVVLTVVGLVLGWHRMRTLRLRRRNLELLDLHRQRKRAQARLSRAYDQLRKLTRRLEATKEEERRRIARELHDEMGPALTAVIINLQLLAGRKDPESAEQRVNESIEIVDRMVQQIRDLSLALRPPLLDEIGFLPAIRGYLETEADRTSLQIDVQSPPALPDFPAEVEISAFRVIQAAVSNVIRHAEANEISVSIRTDDEALVLSIRDDGIGFDPDSVMDPSASESSVGLVGMKERVQILGGEFFITSEPERGTTIDARIPVEVES